MRKRTKKRNQNQKDKNEKDKNEIELDSNSPIGDQNNQTNQYKPIGSISPPSNPNSNSNQYDKISQVNSNSNQYDKISQVNSNLIQYDQLSQVNSQLNNPNSNQYAVLKLPKNFPQSNDWIAITSESQYSKTSTSLSKSKIESNELTFNKIIGQGTFGQVWKGEWRSTIVAIKQVKQDVIDQNCKFFFLPLAIPLIHFSACSCSILA